MVPAIYASTVNPIQNNAMMENGIMAFTVTFLLGMHSDPHATCGLSVVPVGGGRRFAY